MRIFLMLSCLCFIVIARPVAVPAAEDVAYLNDSIKIMMRTGRGNDYRIIAMPSLGQEITVLEDAGDWVKIRTNEENEGWVLSRFVGYEVPYRIRFDALQSQYTEMAEKLAVVEQENNRLTSANQEMTKRLETEIGQMSLQLEKTTRENRVLRDTLANRFIKWFLAGAGVLFFGFLIGYLTKRGRRQTYSF